MAGGPERRIEPVEEDAGNERPVGIESRLELDQRGDLDGQVDLIRWQGQQLGRGVLAEGEELLL
jgi:hypothetical protein